MHRSLLNCLKHYLAPQGDLSKLLTTFKVTSLYLFLCHLTLFCFVQSLAYVFKFIISSRVMYNNLTGTHRVTVRRGVNEKKIGGKGVNTKLSYNRQLLVVLPRQKTQVVLLHQYVLKRSRILTNKYKIELN